MLENSRFRYIPPGISVPILRALILLCRTGCCSYGFTRVMSSKLPAVTVQRNKAALYSVAIVPVSVGSK